MLPSSFQTEPHAPYLLWPGFPGPQGPFSVGLRTQGGRSHSVQGEPVSRLCRAEVSWVPSKLGWNKLHVIRGCSGGWMVTPQENHKEAHHLKSLSLVSAESAGKERKVG